MLRIKTLCTLALLALLHTAFAQTQTIDGFGAMRLGKTTEQILSDLKIKKVITVTNGSGQSGIINHDVATQLVYDSTKPYGPGDFVIKPCGSITALSIPMYKLGDVEVEHALLSFYNNSLYSIYINGPSISFLQAFYTKYGMGTSSSITDTLTCNGFGGAITIYPLKLSNTWPQADTNFVVLSFLKRYWDADCKQHMDNYFTFYNTTVSIAAEGCIAAGEQKIQATQKDKLGNF